MKGVPYVQLEPGLRLRDADFADLYHLLDRGRAKWQPALAATRGRSAYAEWHHSKALSPHAPRR